MAERRLATVENVVEVAPIEGADSIEAARIRNWWVVTRIGELPVGSTCVYFEIDSALPLTDPRFEFLARRGSKRVENPDGTVRDVHVLRTAKLRGTYSQGLALGIEQFPELAGVAVGEDVTAVLGIEKYEPPIAANLAGRVVGTFPTQFAPKTDAERVQNLTKSYKKLTTTGSWYATEKIDGTSVTYIRDPETAALRVCSRNLELAPSDTDQWRIAAELNLLESMKPGMAVQAELYGEGIQKNPLKIRGQRIAVFNVFQDRVLLPRSEWPKVFLDNAAPILPWSVPPTVEEAIEQVDGLKSTINPAQLAEGVVWHNADGTTFDELDGRACFKAISNAFLAKLAKREG